MIFDLGALFQDMHLWVPEDTGNRVLTMNCSPDGWLRAQGCPGQPARPIKYSCKIFLTLFDITAVQFNKETLLNILSIILKELYSI